MKKLLFSLILITITQGARAVPAPCIVTVSALGNFTDTCGLATAINTTEIVANTLSAAGSSTTTAANSGTIVGEAGIIAANSGYIDSNTIAIANATYHTAINTSSLVARNTTKDAQDKLNWLQTLDAYAKGALELQNIIIQTELLVKDIEENPLQVIVPDANQLLANQAQINTLAQNIDQGSGAMSQNLMNNIQHPQSIGLGQGTTFELWSEARAKAVDEALSTAKFLASDAKGQNASFLQLVKNITSAQGPSMAAKNAAEAGKQQVQIAQKMLGAINQLLMLQTTDAGAKVAADMAASNASTSAANASKKLLGDGSTQYVGPVDTLRLPGTKNGVKF